MSAPSAPLNQLPTPALLLDRARLERNLNRMTKHLSPHNIHFRPHVKTAKSSQVVSMALKEQFGGITVSTLREAEFFFRAGH